MELSLTLFTFDIPCYDLPGLNVTISDKPLGKILYENKGQIYGELKKKLAYMLHHDDTELYRNEEEF